MSDMGRKVVADKGRLNRERSVTKALEFPSCTGKIFFITTGTESAKWSVRREAGRQVWWQGTIKETESKGSYLEEYNFFDWEPEKLCEKWFNMLMSAFAKNDFCCMILICCC